MNRSQILERSKYGFILILILFFFSSSTISSQNTTIESQNRHKIGFQLGYGSQDMLKLNYDYDVFFLQIQYYIFLLNKKTWCLEVLIQPQYNITNYRQIDRIGDKEQGFEIGLNAGILIRKYLFKNYLNIYGFISSGPHFVEGTPHRQSNGFNFSSSFFIGTNVKLINNTFLDIRAGIRHLSNLGFTNPNRGINNYVVSMGIVAPF